MQTMTDQELLNTVTPMIEKMHEGWNNNNLETLIFHFSDNFATFMSQDEFNKQRGKYYPQQGELTNKKCLLIHRNPDNIVVIWETSCSKRAAPALLTSMFSMKENNFVMSGASVIF